MNKKIISLMLILVLIVGMIPPRSYAEFNGYDNFRDFVEIGLGKDYIIPNQYTGEPLIASKDTYQEYGLLVYGDPEDVVLSQLSGNLPKFNIPNKVNGRDEFRYLGYSESFQVVSNARYPNDNTSYETPESWISQFDIQKTAVKTWGVLDNMPDLKAYMTQAPLSGNSITNPKFTVETINNTGSVAQMNSYPLNGVSESGYHKTKLLTVGGWFQGFAVRTERHDINGKWWYQTFQGDQMSRAVNQSIETDKPSYIMKGDQEFIDVVINYDVNFVLTPYMKASQVKVLTQTLTANSVKLGANDATNKATNTFTKTARLYRSNLKIGANSVEISGKYDITTVFDSGDRAFGSTNKMVTVTVEPPVEPTVVVTVVPNPTYKMSHGEDVNVAVEVFANTYNISRSNIQSVTIQEKDGSTVQSKNILPNASFSAMFYHTISGSGFSGNPNARIEKVWQGAVIVKLLDGRVLTATNKANTIVVGSPQLPKIVIDAPDTIKMGNIDTITAESTSVNGPITNTTLKEGSIVLDTVTYDYSEYEYIFTKEGTITWNASATDITGEKGYATKNTLVTPPTVDAVIHTEGIHKPFRKVTASSMKSDSPTTYPIVEANTDWTVTSGSITTGDLLLSPINADGHRTFLFGATKSGTFNLGVTLKNSANYSGSASKTVTIVPDLPPVSKIQTVTKVYRDPLNSNVATIDVFNESYSPDGDAIELMSLYYWYDSDNDGNYYEHPHHVAYTGYNISRVSFPVTDVGKYFVRLDVRETYDVMTGLEGAAVKQGADSSWQPLSETVVQVDNMAPSSGIKTTKEELIDLTIQVAQSGTSRAVVESYVNGTLKTELNQKGIKINSINIIEAPFKLELEAYVDQTPYNTSNWGKNYFYNDKNKMITGLDTPEMFINRITGSVTPLSWIYPNAGATPNGATIDWSGVVGNRFFTGRNDVSSDVPSTYFVYGQRSYWSGEKFFSYYLVEIKPDNTVAHYLLKAYSRFDYDTYFRDFNNIDLRWSATDNVILINNVVSGGSGINSWGAFYFDTGTKQVIAPVTRTWDYSVPQNSNWYTGESFGVSSTRYLEHLYNDRKDYSYGTMHRYIKFPVSDTIETAQWMDYFKSTNYSEFYMEFPNMTNYVFDILMFNQRGFTSSFRQLRFKSNIRSNLQVNKTNKSVFVLFDESNLDYMRPLESSKIISEIINRKHIFLTTNKTGYGSAWSSTASGGKVFDSYLELSSAISNAISTSSTSSANELLVAQNEQIKIESLYYDYENDPVYDKKVVANHVDPNYFDNSNGLYPYSGQLQSVFELYLDRVGKYEVSVNVQDNPVGTNSALASYRKWSIDSAESTVIVHRKPIAILDYTKTTQTTVNWIDNSYDLDHSISRADKGIVATESKHKLSSQTAWTDGLPTSFGYVSYDFYHRVKDLEGAWSEPVTFSVDFGNPSLRLMADLVPQNGGYNLNAFPIGQNVVWTNIKVTRPYYYTHHLEATLWDGTTKVYTFPIAPSTESVNSTLAYSSTEGQYQSSHNDIVLNIPSNIGLTNKSYQLKLKAISDYGDGRTDETEKNIRIVANNPPHLWGWANTPTVREGKYQSLYFTFADADLDTLKFNLDVTLNGTSVYKETNTTITPSGGSYAAHGAYPNNLESGTYTVNASISDGKESHQITFNFTVIPNNAPTISGSVNPSTLKEGDNATVSFGFTDADLDVLTFNVTIDKNGTEFYRKLNQTINPSGSVYTDQNLNFSNLGVGTYVVNASISDGLDTRTSSFSFTVKGNNPPSISGTYNPAVLKKGDSVALTFNFADDDLDALIYSVEIYVDGVKYYSKYSTPVTQFGTGYLPDVVNLTNIPGGNYTVYASVSDGLETFYTNYSFVVTINSPPTVSGTYAPTTLYEGDNTNLTFTLADPDLNALTFNYTVLRNGSQITSGVRNVNPSGSSYPVVNIPVTNLDDGNYTVDYSVSDGFASASESFAFTVIPFNIETFEVWGYWNHWRGQVDADGEQLSIQPHRFLSHEKVVFEALITGEIEGAILRLSPELEAMRYTDPHGNVYYYEDDFGAKIFFPAPLKKDPNYKSKNGEARWFFEYPLPYANHTLSWEDNRDKAPYTAQLTVYPKGEPIGNTIASHAKIQNITDIEITGNIHDLIKIRRVN